MAQGLQVLAEDTCLQQGWGGGSQRAGPRVGLWAGVGGGAVSLGRCPGGGDGVVSEGRACQGSFTRQLPTLHPDRGAQALIPLQESSRSHCPADPN